MKRRFYPVGTMIAAALTLSLLSAPARADFLYNVTLDTSGLVGHAAGPFSLDFQLIDGDLVANNTVTLSHFAFGVGASSGAPTLTGGASGDLSSAITLTDASFLNEVTQGFTPGASLSFDLRTTNAFAGDTPDSFSFAILDRSGAELPTLSSSGAFVQIDLSGGVPSPQTFASDPNQAPASGGNPVTIPTPSLQGAATAPEPVSLALLAVAAPFLGIVRRLRRPVG